MVVSNIPVELRELRTWVCHRNKIPLMPDGRPASSTDPSTWSSFDECAAATSFDGIGCVITPPYVGIDLDKCFDPQTRRITRTALRLLRRVQSYTEWSPSGTGLHIWAKSSDVPEAIVCHDLGIEVYPGRRYFTVTGNTLKYRNEIRRCDLSFLNTLQQKRSKKTESKPPDTETRAIAQRAGLTPYRELLPDLKRKGRKWIARCPFHQDERPSLQIDLKNGEHVWFCFPCGNGGDVFEFVRRAKHISFTNAVELIGRGK